MLTYPVIIGIALLHLIVLPETALNHLIGGAMSFGIFYLTAMLKPGSLGGGDVKLAALIGLAYGFPHVLWVFLVGSGAGALVALYLMLVAKHGRSSSIAYGPFLCLGALVGLFYNPITWML